MRVTAVAAGAIGTLLLSIPSGVRAADAPCDRACLNSFTDQYLAALVARDPSKLPLTKTARIRFDHNGRNKTTVWNDGNTHPVNTPLDDRFSFESGELFKIATGKIQQIEALVLNVPYSMPTGWGKKE